MNNVVLNDLFDYGLKIYQDSDYFKFSLDSILLAEYVKITKKVSHILDLCTGNASIPLILSTKTNALIDAFEVQKDVYNLAKSSVNYNKLGKQINLYNNNVLDIDNVLNDIANNSDYETKHKTKRITFDIITCNPPYFKIDENSYINNFSPKAIARHEILITLEDIFKIASSHLSTKGEFYLVHRAARLDEIIILGNKYNLRVKNVELIKTKANGNPYIVLVRCIKDANLGLKINDIKNIENLETYQNLFKEDNK